jgi:hypothetical protein
VTSWLPPLLELAAHGGDWPRYEAAIYEVFRCDFVVRQPVYRGLRVGIQKDPKTNGKEFTFWHVITENWKPDGAEDDRIPDMRRCERIAWPKALIDLAVAGDSRVRCWSQQRASADKRTQTRYVIAPEDFSFVVILADRTRYLHLVTAFPAEPHRQKKFEAEFEAWAAAQKVAAQKAKAAR